MSEEFVEEGATRSQDSDAHPVSEREAPGSATGVVTVVLTADNHLGYAAPGQQPRKREEHEQQLRRAFQQATDFAIAQGVDLFVQAGDLFDNVNPAERDRSFVAARLVQLRQAGVRTFVVGGVHDTPNNARAIMDDAAPAPQISYARLGALHYFAPYRTIDEAGQPLELEPVFLDVASTRVGICGLSVLAGQTGDPLAHVHAQGDIERAAVRILILHAPIEGPGSSSALADTHARVGRASLANQTAFQYILAGYEHSFYKEHIGQSELIVAGATQHSNFSDPDDEPGFVFLGLAADGVRWCKHIAVEALRLRRLAIPVGDLWSADTDADAEQQETPPTERILELLAPLCSDDAMVQLKLEGELTRKQYHQLDLNQIRRYGEQHCFALAIDDSSLSLLPEQEASSAEAGERFSPREELITLADEWIDAADDEQEKRALRATREVLLAAMDEARNKW